MMVVSVLLVLLGVAGLSYVWGCYVGMVEGKRIGRARADAEWAVFMEHGAAPHASL